MKQHTNLRFILAFAIPSAYVFSGCGTLTQTVYLNDLSVSGPIEQPPVHLTDQAIPGEFHFSPKISFAPFKRLETRIDGNIYAGGPNPPTGNNFRWSMPSALFSMDGDWMVSKGLSFSFGLNYAPKEFEESWGGYAGLGLPFTGENVSGRLEAGMHYQTMWYDAHSVVVTEHTSWFDPVPETSVAYFHDINRSNPLNMYATLTVNSHSENSVNFFGSASVSWQTLAKFEPSNVDMVGPLGDYHYTDARAEQSATILFLTPGLVFRLSPTVQLLTGARFMKPFGVGDDLPWLVAPMAQIDVTL